MPRLAARSRRPLRAYALRSALALAVVALALAALASSALAEIVFRTGPGLRADSYGGEVVHLSSDGRLMVKTSAADDEGLALLDVSDVNDPVRLAGIDFQDENLGLVSATFSADDRFVLAAFANGLDSELIVLAYEGGNLEVARRIDLPAQPDSIEVSADGEYAALAIEDESKLLPGGQIEILHLVDEEEPETWELFDVPLVLDPSYTDNAEPQPEYVDFNAANEVAVSIQEQSAIGIIDAPAAVDANPATDPVVKIFPTGNTNFPDDNVLNDSKFIWNPATPNVTARQPDAVAWTADGKAIAAVDEGETTDPHEWTIWDRQGNVVYASGESLNRNAALYGLHPVNFKGTQPEGMTIERYKGREYAFIVTERTATMSVYDLTESLVSPKLVGVYPTGVRPETISFSAKRGLAVTGNETDDSDPSSTLLALDRGKTDPDQPILKGDEPWANMRGLAALGNTKLLAVSSDVPHKLRQIDLSVRGEATMTTLGTLPPAAEPLAQVVEDVVPDGSGGRWITTASAGLIYIPQSGSPTTVPSPVTTPVGIALTQDGQSLIVINATGAAARVPVAGGAATKFTVTTGVAGQFTDLATAPDGRIVAMRADSYNTANGAGATALVSFPADAAEGAAVAATTERTIANGEQSQYASDRLTSLAITPNGDVWFAHGAALNGQNGIDPGFRRLPRVFAQPNPPAPADLGMPSAEPAQPLVGLRYMQAGGELYATNWASRVIADRDEPHGSNMAIVSPQTGATTGMPDIRTDGEIRAIDSDENGGFYLVGAFSTVNGEPAPKVAHVNADGSLDHGFASPTFDNSSTPAGVAFAGGRVWITGGFGKVNGVTRTRIAALNLDGSVDPALDVPINTIPVTFEDLGGKIYVVTNLNTMTLNGQLRPFVGRFDPTTGAVDSFQPEPNVTIERSVWDIALDGSRVILAGDFTKIKGQNASRLAIVDGTTGGLLQNLNVALTGNNPWVKTIALRGRQLWVGGLFGSINGVPAVNLGAIDLDEPANVTPVSTDPGSPVSLVSVLADGGILVGGGDLPVGFAGQGRGIGVIDPVTLQPRTSFAGSLMGEPREALEMGSDRVLIAGRFGLYGKVGPVQQLNRIDLESGEIDPSFDPPDDLKPDTMVADDHYLYLPSGQRLDRRTGEVDQSWSFHTNVSDDTSLLRMIVRDGRLYLYGGSEGSIPTLRQINGVSREGIGSIDLRTGSVTSFNPAANRTVTSAVFTPEGRLFIAGEFTKLGGKSAGRIAEVDPVTGALLPTFDGIAISKDAENFSIRHKLAYDPVAKTLYASNVRSVNGAPVNGLAAFDVSGGAAKRVAEFDPVVSGGWQEDLLWLHGSLLVQGWNSTVNGKAMAPEVSAYTLTPAGDLDPRFQPGPGEICQPANASDQLTCPPEISLFGSRLTVNGQLYVSAPATTPVNTVPPTISGSAVRGQTLTCDTGVWTDAENLAIQWLRDGAPIDGATEASRTVLSADVDHALVCRVTATNGSAVATADSASVHPVAPIGGPCGGAAITGAGDALQTPLHRGPWKAGFAALCPGGPEVDYEFDENALAQWKADGSGGALNHALTFLGTDVAPTASQIANVEAAAGGARVAVIPVAQTAVAIVANPPAGCEVELITNSNLAAVMEGRITVWSKLEGAEGACNWPITRVAENGGGAASTHLHSYLYALTRKGLFCTTGGTEGGASWAELPAEEWPESCAAKTLSPVLRPAAAGGSAALETVEDTPGSIGYATLPEAEAGSATILALQNNGQRNGSEATFAMPALGDAANCSMSYTVPKVNGGLSIDWSGVVGAKPGIGGERYPLCMLTYVLALRGYQAAGFSEGQAVTARTYLHDYVTATAQNPALAPYYSPVPGAASAVNDVRGAAWRASGSIAW